jgi:poly-beta-1,6-N-acetyl-D-glucosamine synthase
MIIETVFWLIILLILHTYVFYPAIMFFLAKSRDQNVSIAPLISFPKVSIIVSVFNEEKVVNKKLQNLQTIDYPSSQIEILIGSDGSTDGSVKILKNGVGANLRVLDFSVRRGKASVLNDLIAVASGEIIVFTDANTEFKTNTVRELVKHFNEPTVGAVSGLLILRSSKNEMKTGEYSYWVFENKLKSFESTVCSLLGATGGVYAIRKTLFEPLPTDISIADDFLIPMEILKKGYRCIFEPLAIAYEELEKWVANEFRRKARIGAQNFNVLFHVSSLLHVRYGLTAFSLWSHKIIRWFVPFFLLTLTILLPFLSTDSSFFRTLSLFWMFFLLVGIFGWIMDSMKIRVGYLGYPYYYLAMNAALFVGFIRSVTKSQKTTWSVIR